MRERGYVEAPIRIASILGELERLEFFERVPRRHFAESHIRAVHDGRLVDYLERTCKELGTERSLYPYVFPGAEPGAAAARALGPAPATTASTPSRRSTPTPGRRRARRPTAR